jgi:hypothetical protein
MNALAPPRLMFLDLRQQSGGAIPPLAGIELVSAAPPNNCKKAMDALAVFVAIDGEAAYADWRNRLHPLCPRALRSDTRPQNHGRGCDRLLRHR